MTLSIENLALTGNYIKYLEFDVLAKANNNNTFYDNALVRISFNTDIFGEELVQNGKVTLSKGAGFNNSTYNTDRKTADKYILTCREIK